MSSWKSFSLIYSPIQVNDRSRYYFILSFVLFGITLTIGWDEAVEAFNEGYEAGLECCEEIPNGD